MLTTSSPAPVHTPAPHRPLPSSSPRAARPGLRASQPESADVVWGGWQPALAAAGLVCAPRGGPREGGTPAG
eukprot:3077019-Rhodomonas_salina.1